VIDGMGDQPRGFESSLYQVDIATIIDYCRIYNLS